MNLREKFFWNAVLSVSIIILLWNIWILFNQHQSASTFLKKYKNEKVGTDKELETMVKNLEANLKKRQELKFRIKDNPVDLTKVIAVDGIASNKGQKGIHCSGAWSNPDGSATAICDYKNITYKVLIGDSIGGGLVKTLTTTKLTISKDKQLITFNFGL